MYKLEVKDLTKIFGRSSQKTINLIKEGKSKDEILKETGATIGVKKANFYVNVGEIFVIMGLSGSGKSTLIRMLNRLIRPSYGEVLLDGKNIATMNQAELREIRRKKISMVFQKFALFPHHTVLENVAFGLEIQGVPKEERNQRALQSLQLVGLENWADSYPDKLSGGMQQRVGLARALVNHPDILLMDEAFSALDPLIRKEMQDELLSLQENLHQTIVFITHDLDEALRIGDRIALMKDGEIIQVGTPEEILTNPADEYVERFVEDVNMMKVLTAENVMKKAEMIMLGKYGPRVALKIMLDKGIPTLIAVDRNKRFQGLITAEGAKKAIKEQLTLDKVLILDVVKAQPNTILNELLPKMAETEFSYPIVVIDEHEVLQGIVGRGAIFAALAGTGGIVDNVTQNTD